MTTLLFEGTWLLAALLVAFQFLLIVIWSRRRSRLWARIVWAGFVAIPSLLVLSKLVVTPTEQIVDLCRTLARLVDEGEVDAIGRHLADEFEAAKLDRTAFLERVADGLTRYRIDNPRLRAFEVEFPRDAEGVAVFNAVCRVRSADTMLQVPSRWRVAFRLFAGKWRVTGLEALPTPLSPVRNLRDWIR